MSQEASFPLSELEVGGRRSVTLAGQEFVVFRTEKDCVAYENRCLHQGGPVCTEGTLHPHLTARVEKDGKVVEYFEEGVTVLACAWHGWEYDLADGHCLAQPHMKLRAASVEIEDDTVVVRL